MNLALCLILLANCLVTRLQKCFTICTRKLITKCIHFLIYPILPCFTYLLSTPCCCQWQLLYFYCFTLFCNKIQLLFLCISYCITLWRLFYSICFNMLWICFASTSPIPFLLAPICCNIWIYFLAPDFAVNDPLFEYKYHLISVSLTLSLAI